MVRASGVKSVDSSPATKPTAAPSDKPKTTAANDHEGIRTRAPSDSFAQPLVAKVGEIAGLAAGVAVTVGLGLVPSWTKPVLDGHGKPVSEVPGAERIGDHDILKRHEEVVGPQLKALAQSIPKGLLHDLVAGLAAGATEAPGTTYRLEAAVEDHLKGDWYQKLK